MTLDVQDRASTASLRFVMTQLTTLIVNAVTANVLANVGWFWLSLIYGIICFVMMLICFIGCKEHIDEDRESGVVKVEQVPLKIALPALLKNRYFFIQALIFCFLYIGVVATGSMTFYFCNIVLSNIAILTYTSMASTIPAIIVNLVMPSLVPRFGKRKLMIVGYGEWKTGVRSEGLVNSCTSFGMKVGIGLGSAVGTWLLSLGNYDGTLAQQPESAINMICFGYGYLGAVVGVIILILCVMMNIDKHLPEIQKTLEAKRIKN